MSDVDEFRAILDAEIEAEVGPEMAARIRALADANKAVLGWYGQECRARIQQRADQLTSGIEAVMWAANEVEWT